MKFSNNWVVIKEFEPYTNNFDLMSEIGIDTEIGTETETVTVTVTETETEIIEKYKYYRVKILKEHGICLSRSYDAHAYTIVKIFSGEITNANDDSDAMELNVLGLYHWLILGDIESAFKFWHRSVAMGNMQAMCNMGIYHSQIKDYNNSLRCYSHAVNSGYLTASCNLCMHYLTTDVNYEKAGEYFRMVKDTDDFFCHLTKLYYHVTVEKDFVQANVCAIKALDCANANLSTSRELGFVHGKIGACYTRAGAEYYGKAIEHLEKAIKYEEFRGLEHVILYSLKISHDKLFDIFKIVFEQDNWKELYDRISNYCNKTIRWKMLFALGKIWDENKRDRALIDSLMKELENDCASVSMLKNKLWKATQYQVLDTCPICLTDNILCVELYCGHHVCYCCFDPKMVCHYKCKNLFCVDQSVQKNDDTGTGNFWGHVMLWALMMAILLTIGSISFGMTFDFVHYVSQKSNNDFQNQTVCQNNFTM